ncbi:MAG: pyridoxal phosphate-dependent aminotransferase [Acidobacteriota bacterium]|nr:pyridoxal phosphate-dependent aminotransferase [Acidobacteriota bacterium]
MLSDRMQHVGMSPTMKGTMEAEKLRRQGIAVVDLGAGEPDFPTPAHITAAAHAALERNFTKYTANAGVAELREAVAARYRADYGVVYDAKDVILSAGGKQALYNAALALFGPGDEVITHAPGWPTLVEQIKLAGAKPVIVQSRPEVGFRLEADRLLAAVTPSTKGIVINSPGNPTGALISEQDAAALADAAAKHGFWILVDLCYERLIYDDHPHNLPKVLTERARDRVVLTGSTSKAYAMTGWRCGWALGPSEVVQASSALQSHSTSNVCSITQMAAIAALTGPQDCVTEMRAEYKRRRDQVLAWLGEDERLRCQTPAGAFYLFPSVLDFLSPADLRTSQDVTDRLLATSHVILTPGEAFDAPGYVRISYATSLDTLREGITRLLEFLRAAEAGRGPGAGAR